MASKKKETPVRVCRIFQWIEHHDRDFAGAIRDLCLEGALNPGRGAGVTFLYPKEKEYRASIIEKAKSDEADEAEKMVASLIIPDVLLDWGQFNQKTVGSRLGVKYAVESADATKVKLAGGVELVPADDFVPLARRAGDIAVWLVTKGRLPLAGEEYRAPKRGGPKVGGAARHPKRGGDPGYERGRLAAAVEADYDACMRRDLCRSHNPALAKVVSLLNYLKAKAPETFAALCPVLDYDPLIAFYLIVEPYKTHGAHLVSDDLIAAWCGVDLYSDAVAEYEAMFRAGAGAGAAAVAAQVDAVRQRLAQLAPRQWPQEVQNAYAELSQHNRIGGTGPVLPEAAHAALAGGKKLWQDEFRFRTWSALQNMRAAPYASEAFYGIVRDIRAVWPGNNYEAEVQLTNLRDFRGNVAPRAELLLLMKFVNSTDLLYVPAAPDALGEAQGDLHDPSDTRIYNRNLAAASALRHTSGMVRPSGVSPQTVQELQIYVQMHGRLPAEIAALVAAAAAPPQ